MTVHELTDRGQQYGFNQIDYEAIQRIPILRNAWLVSLHGLAQTAKSKDGQQIPFFHDTVARRGLEPPRVREPAAAGSQQPVSP